MGSTFILTGIELSLLCTLCIVNFQKVPSMRLYLRETTYRNNNKVFLFLTLTLLFFVTIILFFISPYLKGCCCTWYWCTNCRLHYTVHRSTDRWGLSPQSRKDWPCWKGRTIYHLFNKGRKRIHTTSSRAQRVVSDKCSVHVKRSLGTIIIFAA